MAHPHCYYMDSPAWKKWDELQQEDTASRQVMGRNSFCISWLSDVQVKLSCRIIITVFDMLC